MKILEHTMLDMLNGVPFPEEPFFLYVGMLDVPTTVIKACNALPDSCVGVSVKSQGILRDKIVDNQIVRYVEFV